MEAALNDAQSRLKAAADPKPARTKAPASFSVFVENAEKSLVCVTEWITAASRKDAIKKAVAANGGEPKEGRFLVVPSSAVSWHNRKIKTEVVETFE
jgi:hypothetical protein